MLGRKNLSLHAKGGRPPGRPPLVGGFTPVHSTPAIKSCRWGLRLLQQLGHFLLHAVGLGQGRMPVWLRISYLDMLEVAVA